MEARRILILTAATVLTAAGLQAWNRKVSLDRAPIPVEETLQDKENPPIESPEMGGQTPRQN